MSKKPSQQQAILAPHAPGRPSPGGMPFDLPVPPGGYAWWYFDADSSCGTYGICIIAFVGSVFSPHYARALAGGPAAADDHVAFNVVLYGPRRGWSFAEQPAGGAPRVATCFSFRNSAVRATDAGFVLDLDAPCTPGFGRIQGQICFTPEAAGGTPRPLDAQGAHHWWPVAPACRVTVELRRPQLAWQGRGYHDVNWGSAPLHSAFSRWSWLRAFHPQGTLVQYVPQACAGAAALAGWATLYKPDGTQQDLALPAPQHLAKGRWGLRPQCHGPARLLQQLEDTPFYTRARIALSVDGHTVPAMHEYLDLVRWQAPWVQFLLPFRLRRYRRAA